MQEVKKKKAAFNSISDKLEPIYLVLNPESSKTLQDLTRLLEQNSSSLDTIETNLQEIHTSPKHLAEKGRGSIFRSFGGRKQDKVQDRRNVEENNHFRDNDVFQEEDEDSSDESSPYARIDNLQKKILRETPPRDNPPVLLSPPAGRAKSGRPVSISGQVFNLPAAHNSLAASSSLNMPSRYEKMEEILPSPFLEPDIVSNKYQTFCIEDTLYSKGTGTCSSPTLIQWDLS